MHAEAGTEHVEQGIDLSEYYINVEWDILKVPAERHVKASIYLVSEACTGFFFINGRFNFWSGTGGGPRFFGLKEISDISNPW